MDTTIVTALVVLHLLAVIDVWMSRLTRGAKVLWSLAVIFLTVVGVASWLLTRESAYQPLDPIIPSEDPPADAAEPIT